MNNAAACSTCTVLCDHPLYLILKHFHCPKREPHTHSSRPHPLSSAPGNHQSAFCLCGVTNPGYLIQIVTTQYATSCPASTEPLLMDVTPAFSVCHALLKYKHGLILHHDICCLFKRLGLEPHLRMWKGVYRMLLSEKAVCKRTGLPCRTLCDKCVYAEKSKGHPKT